MIYIVNGFPGSGKTSFEKLVCDMMPQGYGRILSTINPVKNIATMCGWSGEKTPESRKFLSDLKKLLMDFNKFPRKGIFNELKMVEWDIGNRDIGSDEVVVFIDCREPDEIQYLCKALCAKSVLVSRTGVDGAGAINSSDRDVLNYKYDIEIANNGDLRDLAETAYKFVKDQKLKIRKDPFYIDLFGEVK